MSIVPVTLFGVLSLLYLIVYGVKDLLVWPLLYLGLTEQEKPMQSTRSRDPSGVKRAKAATEARRTREMFNRELQPSQ